MAEADRIDQPPPRARHLGGWLMWFAVLGGAVAWTLHLFVSWGTEELACASGHTTVDQVPLEAIIGAGVVLPALATVAALALSLRARRHLSGRRDDRRMERAALLALIGVGANTLFLAIIVAGGAALLVFPPCQQ
jgi:hypothetical protein